VSNTELEAEQAYIDHAYACLDDSRSMARKLSETLEVGAGGTNQARFEREAFTDNIVDRLQQLDIGDSSLVFGRIDHEGEHNDSLYIGRVGVWDRQQDPVVVDWRAPAAEPFYRATGSDSLGINRRRHFALRKRTLLGIDDEFFGDLSRLDQQAQSSSGIQGEGALIAALETAQTKVCWSLAQTDCSLPTSSRCFPLSARRACASPCCPIWYRLACAPMVSTMKMWPSSRATLPWSRLFAGQCGNVSVPCAAIFGWDSGCSIFICRSTKAR